MFCKKCGKEIDSSSEYCQYCGEHVGEKSKTNNSFLRHIFQTGNRPNRVVQTVIMSYIIWLIFWIILNVSEAFYDDEEWWIYFWIFGIGVPVLALFVWYTISVLWKDKIFNKDKDNNESEAFSNLDKTTNAENSFNYTIDTLMDFARKHGKMQVKEEMRDGLSSDSYCVFINEMGFVVPVQFNQSIGKLSATEISLRKEHLFVIKFPDGHFELTQI